jgi:hypothetical protein
MADEAPRKSTVEVKLLLKKSERDVLDTFSTNMASTAKIMSKLVDRIDALITKVDGGTIKAATSTVRSSSSEGVPIGTGGGELTEASVVLGRSKKGPGLAAGIKPGDNISRLKAFGGSEILGVNSSDKNAKFSYATGRLDPSEIGLFQDPYRYGGVRRPQDYLAHASYFLGNLAYQHEYDEAGNVQIKTEPKFLPNGEPNERAGKAMYVGGRLMGGALGGMSNALGWGARVFPMAATAMAASKAASQMIYGPGQQARGLGYDMGSIFTSHGAQEQARGTIESLKASWFGLNPSLGMGDALAVNKNIGQLGYSEANSNIGAIRSAMFDVVSNLGLSPETATGAMDMYMRYGAGSLNDMTAALYKMRDSAQQARMSVEEYTKQMLASSRSLADASGIELTTATSQIQTLSDATGLKPEEAAQLAQNDVLRFMGMGHRGMTPGQYLRSGREGQFNLMEIKNLLGSMGIDLKKLPYDENMKNKFSEYTAYGGMKELLGPYADLNKAITLGLNWDQTKNNANASSMLADIDIFGVEGSKNPFVGLQGNVIGHLNDSNNRSRIDQRIVNALDQGGMSREEAMSWVNEHGLKTGRNIDEVLKAAKSQLGDEFARGRDSEKIRQKVEVAVKFRGAAANWLEQVVEGHDYSNNDQPNTKGGQGRNTPRRYGSFKGGYSG